MKVTTIWKGSPAWKALTDALAAGDTYAYKVSISVDEGFKVKVNEDVWTPPLSTEVPSKAH